ncbi:MAG: hypothetical protein PVJ15_04645 [Gammaproteobacteria bacterium]|jgi:hypothetical protein
MNRRLYFLFPDRVHALSAVNELAASGVPEEDIHALADKEIPLDGLPNAISRQKHDAAHRHHPEAAIGGVGWGTGAFGL